MRGLQTNGAQETRATLERTRREIRRYEIARDCVAAAFGRDIRQEEALLVSRAVSVADALLETIARPDAEERLYFRDRCNYCGHRLAFAASACPECWKVFDGREDPETWPENCECERCAAMSQDARGTNRPTAYDLSAREPRRSKR